jgi:hypothetical protein
MKAYYLKNKEKILERAKEKYQTEAGKAYQKAYQKAYNQTEAGKAKRKKYKKYQQSEKGKEKRKAANKKYNQSEKGKVAQKRGLKKYQQSEKGKAYIKKYHQSEKWKAYIKNRYHNGPVYKLQHNLRVGFCQWIKGTAKTCKTEQYVGCTYKELLDHLERQFEEGMTWENHGRGNNKWHIDHIKAQSRFDPTIEEEAFKCWHYTNLQPMWAEINIKYSNKKKPGDENRIWMGREIGWVHTLELKKRGH